MTIKVSPYTAKDGKQFMALKFGHCTVWLSLAEYDVLRNVVSDSPTPDMPNE